MKILLLTTHLNVGGIAAYTVSLARELKRRGHTPVVAASGGDLVSLLEKDIPYFHVPLNTKSELSPRILMTFLKLLFLVKKQKIDIIHAQTRVAQVSACLVSKATGIPFVSTCHGFFRRNLGRRMMPCWGERVVAISDAVREHLANDFRVHKKKIHLIYNGVEIERFKEDKPGQIIEQFKHKFNIDEKDLIIGIIARLSDVKGHRFLLMAAKEIIESGKKVKFLIIGDGPEKEPLLELTKKLDIEQEVVFSAPVFDTSLALKTFDIFVMPSIQEGLGLSILEAMAGGLPVIASNVGGIYTLIKDGVNGFLVPPGNPHAIFEAVNKFIAEPDLAKRMGREGQRIAEEKFSIDGMIEKTLKLYAEVLQAPAAGNKPV